jgi:hypothetical protein
MTLEKAKNSGKCSPSEIDGPDHLDDKPISSKAFKVIFRKT